MHLKYQDPYLAIQNSAIADLMNYLTLCIRIKLNYGNGHHPIYPVFLALILAISLSLGGCALPTNKASTAKIDTLSKTPIKDAQVSIRVNASLELGHHNQARLENSEVSLDSDRAWQRAGEKLSEELAARGIHAYFNSSSIPESHPRDTHLVVINLTKFLKTTTNQSFVGVLNNRNWRVDIFDINRNRRTLDLIFSREYESDQIECFRVREPVNKEVGACQAAMIKFLADQISSRWQ